MTRRSFSITAEELRGRSVTLRGPRRAHFLKAFPPRKRSRLELLGGGGEIITARLARQGRDEVVLQVTSVRQAVARPFRLTLAAAVLKPKNMDFLVEKAAELGASRILPLLTSRTVAAGKGGTGRSRLARWRGKAAAAAAMNESPQLAQVLEAMPLSSLSFERGELVLALCAGGECSLYDVLRRSAARHLVLVVGPEGDFTPTELAELGKKGARTVRLGEEVLRAETAALSALAIVNSIWRWR